LHFVGIGGCGMSGLALVAQQLGATVSGSDRGASIFTESLAREGIEASIGHDAAHVPPDAELVISTAIPAENPERLLAAERGQRELHRAELLAELTRLRRCVAVAGTHGKTTTSAMLVHLLVRCGLRPSFVIGGLLRSAGGHARWEPEGEWLVVEADESDRSLLKLDVDLATLLNAELDHHGVYGSEEDVREVFRLFLERPARAVIADDPQLLALRKGAPTRRFALAVDREELPGGLVAQRLSGGEQRLPGGLAAQRLRWNDLEVMLPLPGLHNAVNALAALETAVELGVPARAAAAALADFPGIARRFERIGVTASGATVYDDYGHHPTELEAAIATARELAPARLVVVFQPHLFSRTAGFAEGFGEALARADELVVCEIYPAREQASDWPGVSARLVLDAAARHGAPRTAWAADLDQAERWLRAELHADDVCLVIGAGDIGTLGPRLVAVYTP
jgi:UDP-N-acetylmuramate--alanine ligase